MASRPAPGGKAARAQATTEAEPITLDNALTTDQTVSGTLATQAPGGALATYDASELGLGFEDTTAADIKIPLIGVVQSNSPQATAGHPKQVKGAQAGMFLNSLTNKLYDGRVGLRGVIIARRRQFFEAVPRTKGGGIVGRHAPDSPLVRKLQREQGEFGKLALPNGNEMFESVSVYVTIDHGEGRFENAVIPFASTNIGEYQKWYTILREQKVPVPGTTQTASLPLFAHRLHFTTAFRQNQKGQWQGIVIQPDAPPTEDVVADLVSARLAQTDPLYLHAREMFKLIGAGRVVVDEGAESDAVHADHVAEL